MTTFLLVGDTLLAGEVWVAMVDVTTLSRGSVGGFMEPERMKWILIMTKIS